MSVLVSRSLALREHTPLSHDHVDMHECADLQSAAASFMKFVITLPGLMLVYCADHLFY